MEASHLMLISTDTSASMRLSGLCNHKMQQYVRWAYFYTDSRQGRTANKIDIYSQIVDGRGPGGYKSRSRPTRTIARSQTARRLEKQHNIAIQPQYVERSEPDKIRTGIVSNACISWWNIVLHDTQGLMIAMNSGLRFSLASSFRIVLVIGMGWV